jgi:hypothetical protein
LIMQILKMTLDEQLPSSVIFFTSLFNSLMFYLLITGMNIVYR